MKFYKGDLVEYYQDEVRHGGLNIAFGSLAEVTEDFDDSGFMQDIYLHIHWIITIKRKDKSDNKQNDGGYYPTMFKLVYNANSSNINYLDIEEFIKEIENII